MPFGELVSDTPLTRVLEELIADPFDGHTPESIAEMTEISVIEASDALEHLESIGMVRKFKNKYQVCIESRRFYALTLLAYAIAFDQVEGDDRE